MTIVETNDESRGSREGLTGGTRDKPGSGLGLDLIQQLNDMAMDVNNVKSRVIKVESQQNFHKTKLDKIQDMAATF